MASPDPPAAAVATPAREAKRATTRPWLVVPALFLVGLALSWAVRGGADTATESHFEPVRPGPPPAGGLRTADAAAARLLGDAAAGKLAGEASAAPLVGARCQLAGPGKARLAGDTYSCTWKTLCWVSYEGTFDGPGGAGSFRLTVAVHEDYDQPNVQGQCCWEWVSKQPAKAWVLDALKTDLRPGATPR